MDKKRNPIAHIKFSGQASEPETPRGLRDGKLTAGVPLTRLIRRKLQPAPELVMLSQPRSVASEKFRRLKTVLLNDPEGPPQVIIVTSAAPSEGKSMVSLNLALALAADRRGEVLAIDADMRRPKLDRWLTPPPKLGLSELLMGRTELEHVTLELENSPLRLIPAGAVARDPVELLSGENARVLLRTLRQRFQRIIIDTPPIVPFTDADAIGAAADGAIIVARADSTRRGMLRQALRSMTSTRVIGTVLNDVTYTLADRDDHYSTAKYYEYYDRERD